MNYIVASDILIGELSAELFKSRLAGISLVLDRVNDSLVELYIHLFSVSILCAARGIESHLVKFDGEFSREKQRRVVGNAVGG